MTDVCPCCGKQFKNANDSLGCRQFCSMGCQVAARMWDPEDTCEHDHYGEFCVDCLNPQPDTSYNEPLTDKNTAQ